LPGGRAPRLDDDRDAAGEMASALEVSVESLCAGMRWDREAQRFAVER
jgi:hypothetical protein